MKKKLHFEKIMISNHSVFTIKIFLFLLSTILLSTNLFSQVNCTGDTPHFTVDLSADPAMTFETPAAIRDGSCCNGADVNCVEFTVYLHPDAVGILFDVASGANPGGALDYQVDCGPITASGSAPICLTGTGPHYISFCKPGNNQNTYELTSVPGPTASDDIIASDGCADTLYVTGLDPNTVTWNSISPGAYGEFNNYLSDLDETVSGTSGDPFEGFNNVLVTPQPGFPSEIQFEVCGLIDGPCSAGTFCDTVTVTIVPDLLVNINPQAPTICYDGSNIELLANVSGGVPPYTYIWNTGDITQGIVVTDGGTYFVQVNDQTGCHVAMDSVDVVQFMNPITAEAGDNIVLCQDAANNIQLNGVVNGTNTGLWTTDGTGTFTPNNSDLNATYIPSNDDINNGSVALYLMTTNNGSCPGDIDTLTITFTVFDAQINSDIINISCHGESDGSISLNSSLGATIVSYDWSNGESTSSIENLDAGIYEVLVTDENGCSETLNFEIIEPNPLVLTDTTFSVFPSSHNISCFGYNDGFINTFVNGGIPPYSFEWSNGEITQNISGIISGTYDVVITDQNGCEIAHSFELVEPDSLLLNTTLFEFPSGHNISCFEANDGSLEVILSGGSPGYIYNWTGPNGFTSNNQNLNSLEAGTYSLTAFDNNGCEIMTTVIIEQPDPLVIELEIVDVLCFGDNNGSAQVTVTGGSPTYNIAWLDSNSNNIGSALDINNLMAGNYSVEITDLNSCNIIGQIIISEPNELEVTIEVLSDYNGHAVNCINSDDGSIMAVPSGGSAPYQYSWNSLPQINAQQLDNIGVGNYTVTLIDSNGCVSSASTELTGNPLPEFSYSDYGLYCEGETATIESITDANHNCTWVFSTGETVHQCGEFQIDFNVVGCIDAELLVTNEFGCTDTAFIEEYICFEPIPDASFSQSEHQITTIPSNVQFWSSMGGGYHYEWDFGDGFGSDEINPNHYFPDDVAGIYEVQLIVTSMFGCSDTSYSVVEVQEEFIIYVPNTFTPDGNQFNEVFMPVLTSGYDPYSYHLIIFNRWGEVLFESYDAEVGWDGTYGNHVVKDGTYVWKIEVSDKANAQRRQFKGHVNVLR